MTRDCPTWGAGPERQAIWRVQMHPSLTPLAPDVDFRALAERYEVSGGDIRNAVLKAALAAAAQPGSDRQKRISHQHLEDGIRDVIAGKRVMRQSLVDDAPASAPDAVAALLARIERAALTSVIVAGAALVIALKRLP